MAPAVVHEEPEQEVAAAEEEEEEQGPNGALGMLVGAMLRTKKQELHNVTHGGETSAPTANPPTETPNGPPSLLRKSRSLLSRISVPLISVPDIKEVEAPEIESKTEGGRPEGSEPPSLLRKSRSLLSRVSMSRKPQKEEEHSIAENTTQDRGAVKVEKKKRQSRVTFEEPHKEPQQKETATGDRRLRRTKSLYHFEEGPSLSRMSMDQRAVGPHRPALCRASMPLIKVLDKKQQAYLEKQRHAAEHMMREGEGSPAGADAGTPVTESGGSSGSTPPGSGDDSQK